MPTTLLTIDRLGYRYHGASVPALSDFSCTVMQGECVCLTGASGCGKSTLLLAVMGLLRGGTRTGSVALARHPVADGSCAAAAQVFQNPESQMLCTTVAEEVAFGPENLCVPPGEITRRVSESLRAVGLGGMEERSAERFSAGQKQRLAIAAVLSMQPRLLLLDEPTSQLDPRGKIALAKILADLKKQGHTMILAEHDPRPFATLIDRYLVPGDGRLIAATETLPEPAQYLAPERAGAAPHPLLLDGAHASLQVDGLGLSYPETGEVLKNLRLKVRCGERVHIFGGNGAGKSSLLRCLAGLERPDSGTVSLVGIANPRPEQLPGRVGVLFQNPARQLFCDSVRDEVAFTLQRLGCRSGEVADRVAEALEFCGIAHLAGRPPLTLSFGEQHRVALAAVVAPRPELLLLDEPFSGLDFPQRRALLDILAQLPVRYGSTVLIASHDELPDPRWADRSFLLHGGALAEISR